jgi:hypothetical protein
MPAAAGPDPSRLREFPLSIWYVKEGLTYTVRTVSEEYQGFFTHHKKRSEYCPGDRCQCRLRNERRIWLGYASIVRWEAQHGLWVPCVLQITESLEHCFDGVFRRGQEWTLSRRTGDEVKKHYPVVGQLVGNVPADQVPPHFPYLDTLLRAYHVSEIQEWYRNPYPRPTKVALPAATPPGSAEPPQPSKPVTQEMLDAVRRRARGDYSHPNGNGQS